MKNKNPFLLLIVLNIFAPIFMLNEDDSCDAEKTSPLMVQWYTQVYESAQKNHNISQHIYDLHAKLLEMEQTMKENHKTMAETHLKLEQCLRDQSLKVNGDIVIQRRQDGSEDFFRTWAEYKTGFGNSSGEFFIGLDKLHKLTNTRPYELLVVLEDFDNDRRYAKYDQFIIGSEVEKYALKQVGTYSGSAGDSMIYEKGQKFSTKDQDNDVYGENCAAKFTGAWWYRECHHSNLNGRYLKGTHTEYAQGINWLPFRGHYYSLKFVEMIIRPC